MGKHSSIHASGPSGEIPIIWVTRMQNLGVSGYIRITQIKGHVTRPPARTLHKNCYFSAWLPAASGLSYFF